MSKRRVGRPRGKSKAKIEKEMIQLFDSAIRELAETVAEKIETEYGRVITGFYNDRVFPYNKNDQSRPISYNRTFSLYEASNANDGINSPGVIIESGNGFLSGIEISPNNIDGNPYRASNNFVFSRAFYAGVHGFSRKTISKANKRRKKKGADWLLEFGHIPFTSYYNAPGMHYNKPITEMDWGYKRIVKKSNMDKLWLQALKNNGL